MPDELMQSLVEEYDELVRDNTTYAIQRKAVLVKAIALRKRELALERSRKITWNLRRVLLLLSLTVAFFGLYVFVEWIEMMM